MDENQYIVTKPARAYTSGFGQQPTYGAWQPPFGGGEMYPGLGGMGGMGGGNLPTPYNQQSMLGAGFGSGASSGSGSGFNFNQVKTFVDRMGGIDGIMGTMGKMQKIFQSVQQMAPMMKLLMGSFLKGGGSATTTGRGNRLERWPSSGRRSSGRRRRPLSTRRRRTIGLRPRTRVRYSQPRRR
jgi:hypothetical protein